MSGLDDAMPRRVQPGTSVLGKLAPQHEDYRRGALIQVLQNFTCQRCPAQILVTVCLAGLDA